MTSSTFDKMSPEQRLTAVNVDLANNKTFAIMSGVACVGVNKFSDALPTAGTDGRDVYWNPDFLMTLTRKQLRFVVLHESFHKALRHCSEYQEICKREPKASNIAMDYVVNSFIEEADPEHAFIDYPDDPKPLLHPKYYGMSFIQVLRDLLKNAKPIQLQPQSGDCDEGGADGDGDAVGKVFVDPDGNPIDAEFDEHMIGELSDDELKEADKQIEDAKHQGQILAQKLAGKGSRGGNLDNIMAKRDTNWREHLRNFISEICEGDEQSRFSPPNKRMLPQGIIMPSHFTESTGEIIVACDTSGSMGGLYPTVFGEIARICENVNPESVRILWWECDVVGEQVFKPIDYANIGKLMKPVGGGGTRVTCVAEHVEQNKLKPKCIIYLTDGYIESDYRLPEFPVLFGAVDNDSFVASRGKTLHIYS
jgi:predicted metal-dependent peptidase